MVPHTISMIKYWRKALIDGKSQKGRMSKKDFARYHSETDLREGRLCGNSLELWRKSLGDDKEVGGLFVAPFVYQRGMDHGKTVENDKFSYLIPLYFSCTADRDGVINPQSGTLPLIPRDILEPVDDSESSDSFAIASMDEYTEVLSRFRNRFEEMTSFSEFWDLSISMLNELAPNLETIAQNAKYQKCNDPESVVLYEDNENFFIQNILKLYDSAIRDLSGAKPPAVSLLDRLCSGESQEKDAPPLADSFTQRLGYANNQHSLAKNQRLAAACLLNLNEGEVLAVNGPPGTGKTSMLLSLIATEFSAAALREDKYPPIIVAASTNNQAVTNILADFAKIPSEEGIYKRWLPKLTSFGSFYPSFDKKDKAIKDGYITDDFFKDVTRDFQYLSTAKSEFLAQGAKAAGKDLPLDGLVAWLHEQLKAEHHKLVSCRDAYQPFAKFKEELLNEDANVFKIGPVKAAEQLDEFTDKWHEMWRNRSLGEKIFSWLPSWKKRLNRKKENVFEGFTPNT